MSAVLKKKNLSNQVIEYIHRHEKDIRSETEDKIFVDLPFFHLIMDKTTLNNERIRILDQEIKVKQKTMVKVDQETILEMQRRIEELEERVEELEDKEKTLWTGGPI